MNMIKGATVWMLLLALYCFCGFSARATNELDVEQTVISEFATPHTDWAVPYALGKTRVLWFVNVHGEPVHARDVVEFGQRFDCCSQMALGDKTSSTQAVWNGEAAGIARIQDLLDENEWDAFVFLDMPVELLPAAQQSAVLAAVNAGAGLVLVGVNNTNILQSANAITNIPAWFVSSSSNAVGDIYNVGSGRGIRLPTQPTIGYRLGWEVDYDLWEQRLGKAVLWAANKMPDVALAVARANAVVQRSSLPSNVVTVTWTSPSQATNLNLLVSLRRNDGWAQDLASIPATNAGSAAVQVPLSRAGDYNVDVIARSARGIETYGTVGFTVTNSRQVVTVNVAQAWGEIGQSLTGTVTCAGTAANADERLMVSLLDRRGRELMRQNAGYVGAQGNFSFTLEDWLPMQVTIRAMLVMNWPSGELATGAEISSAWVFANITQRRHDRFNFVMWGVPRGRIAPYATESLAQNGVTVFLEQYNIYPLWGAAYDTPRVPYAVYIPADSTACADGRAYTNCWNDEAKIQPFVDNVISQNVANSRQGVFAYSLGDENVVRSSCLNTNCLAAYRIYLQQEYGVISALNASWNTNYAGFGDVQLGAPADNNETNAYAIGNYPRWFDRKAFQSYNYCKLCGRFGAAFRAMDSQSRCGFEGAGTFSDGDDLDLFVRTNGFWSPYEGPQSEVLRSIAPRDFPRSFWSGYTKDADSILDLYWEAITLGSDSIWWWMWSGIGAYHGWVAPNLDPYPAIKEVMADTQVVREGLVDLLLKCSMQDDGVGILYSHPSANAGTVQHSSSYFSYTFNHVAWHSALRELGLNFKYFTDRQMRLGEVNLGQYKVVILPLTQAIGTNEVQLLRNYVSNGGVLVADVRPGIYDGHMKPLASGALDDVFGVTRTGFTNAVTASGTFTGALGGITLAATANSLRVDSGIAANGARVCGSAGATPLLLSNSYGNGKAFLLNFSMASYPALSALTSSVPENVADVVKALLNEANVTPALTLRDAAGQRLRNVKVTRWQNGNTEIVSIFRRYGSAEAAEVNLTNSAYVYDIKNHQCLGAGSNFNLQITPCRAQFFAFSGQTLPAPSVSVTNATVVPGSVLNVNLGVSQTNALQAIKVKVTLPNGRTADWLDKVIVTNSPGATIEAPIAYNDPCGVWTITATELFSQQSATTTVTVALAGAATNLAPTVLVAAKANPNPATGTTAELSALGADDDGEPSLTYTWVATGTPPAAVDFQINGQNAAKHTQATFHKSGVYNLQAIIRDAGNLTTTSSVNVTVTQTSAIAITPSDGCLNAGMTYPFAAKVIDQFGYETTQPTGFAWSVTGGGTIDAASGMFNAVTAGGPYAVTAIGGGITGTTSVTVTELNSTNSGLVGWWKFDGNAQDSSGVGNHGTPGGTVAYVPGVFGQAAKLIGGCVSCGNNASLALTNEATIAFWMNASAYSSYPGSSATYPINKWWGGGDSYACFFFADWSGSCYDQRNILFYGNQAGTFKYASDPVQRFAINLGEWYHVAWVYSSAGGGVIYVNGRQIGTAYGGGPLVTNTANFKIGDYYYDGAMDDVRVYNRALSAAQVIALCTNLAPIVTAPAVASPNPVTGVTASLSVLATDDDSEANLTYTWAVTGTPPAQVTFSANGNNAAKNTTATFANSGVYALQVTIEDLGNLTVTGSVNVTVVQTGTSITVEPQNAGVASGATLQFTATKKDQFGCALAQQPGFTWTVSGGGSIGTNGLFTAGATLGGPYTVTAASGGITGTASVTVANPPAIVSQPQSRTNDPETEATFSVVATGSAPLSYQWLKNEAPIGGATATNYTLSSVAASDGGNYRCMVSNIVTAVTSATAVLTVNTFNVIPWTDDYEPYTNGTPLINGTNGWYGADDGMSVQNLIYYGGAQAAKVPYGTICNKFLSNSATNVWLQMDMRIVRSKDLPPAVDTNNAVMFYVNSNGYFVVHNGVPAPTPTNSVNWVTLTTDAWGQAAAPVASGTWAKVHVRQNYVTRKSALFVNRVLLADGIGFIDPAIADFRAFGLNSESSTSYLDNVSVTVTNPLDIAGAIGLNPTSLTYSATFHGALPSSQTLSLTNIGQLPFAYTVTCQSGPNWFTAVPAAGQLASHAGQALTCAANSAVLTAGVHVAILTIDSPDAANSPQTCTATLTVNKANQTISFQNPGNQAVTNMVQLSATASSYLPVTNFTVIAGPGVIAGGNNLTFTTTGLVSIVASRAGNANWNAAPNVTNTFSVGKASQTITFPNPGYQLVTNTVRLSATASSGLAVTNFSVVAGPGVIAGLTNLTFTTTGTVTIAASQAGNANWNAAPNATNAFNVGTSKADQTIAFPNPGAQAVSNVVWLSATASSGLPVTNFSVVAGPGVIVGLTTLTFTTTGAVTIAASQPGNGNWNAAPNVTNTFDASKANQIIAFPNPGDQLLTNTVRLSATASSALPVTNFSVVAGPGVISGLTNLSFTATGAVSIAAGQAGNANWNAAPNVTNTFGVLAAYPMANVIPWADYFESYSNATPLVNGTNGWYGSGADIIVQNMICNGGVQAAKIPYGTLLSQFQGNSAGNVWLQMDLRPLRNKDLAPAVDTNNVIMFYVNSNGYFVAHNGAPYPTPTNSVNWITFTNDAWGQAAVPVAIGEWVRVHVRQNYATGKSAFFVNRILMADAIGFVNPAITNFRGFGLSSESATSYLDNVSVSVTNPPELILEDGMGMMCAAQKLAHAIARLKAKTAWRYDRNASGLSTQWKTDADPKTHPTDSAAYRATPVSGDFDADGKTDLALYEESTGRWHVKLSGSGKELWAVTGPAGSGLTALAGDFDGDRKADPALYNEATGNWTIWQSGEDYTPVAANLGGAGFKPAPGDFDGQGMEDLAVYRESSGNWRMILSETAEQIEDEFGAEGYIPAIADYDGDAKADLAVYEKATGDWYVKLTGSQELGLLEGFGGPSYRPVAADYDGDRLADIALYEETTGNWLWLSMENETLSQETAGRNPPSPSYGGQSTVCHTGNILKVAADVPAARSRTKPVLATYKVIVLEGFGGAGYVPISGDMDGDMKADIVIYEAATGTWIGLLSSMGYSPNLEQLND